MISALKKFIDQGRALEREEDSGVIGMSDLSGSGVHETVLLQSSLDGLGILPGEVFVDATINGGGHSEEVAKRFGSAVRIVGLDVDRDALERSKNRLQKASANFRLVRENFRNIDKALAGLVFSGYLSEGKVSRILFDLGWSSNQFELSGKGFSFMKNEPLIMTLGEKEDAVATAGEIINTWEEEVIANILFGYGEERFSRRIARAIVKEREKKPIETAAELASIIEKAVPSFYRNRKTHAATKSFQGLRIAVNDELGALRDALPKAFAALQKGGRMAVISFHSIEDRIVKQFMKAKASADEAVLVTKKPTVAARTEVKKNPRARSAKLRIIQKK